MSQVPRSSLVEAEYEEGEESLEEKESYLTEVVSALVDSPEAPEFPNIALSNQPLFYQAQTSLLKMMSKMTQFMGQITQNVSPRDRSRDPSTKLPDSFDATQAHKLTGFI
ncbi:hypothetical protein O181_019493 [Austropuccinia psidii MF-1]|uniref:Uncharacterized protein n=1 Tax=Austropuccinia psidii MF-1 TaxID=1389203 RepID=A0A9Q3C9R3_9BASI|nr:hypothetical protein [Austropuccinia psidii MF-1]